MWKLSDFIIDRVDNFDWGFGSFERPMDSVAMLKPYNPNKFKGESADPKLSNQILARGEDGWKPYAKKLQGNIVAVRKLWTGYVPDIGEDWKKIKKDWGDTQDTVHFTNEIPVFQTEGVALRKWFWQDYSLLWFGKQADLMTMIKSPTTPSWDKNPIHKIGLSRDNESYDTSYVQRQYIIYMKLNNWDMVRIDPKSSYWRWKDPDAWTFEYMVNEAVALVKEETGRDKVSWLSLLNMIKFKVSAEADWDFFKLRQCWRRKRYRGKDWGTE